MSPSPPNPTLQSPVLQLVVFSIGGQRYALPLPAVERVLPMVAVSPLPQAPAVALGVINVHGQVVPVLDLRRRFGLPSRDYGLTAQLLVARTRRRTLALPVDEVLGVSEVAAEDIAPPDAVLVSVARGVNEQSLGILLVEKSRPDSDM